MKRSYRFIEPIGAVHVMVSPGREIEVPIFAGILKHPGAEQLAELLRDPAVLSKYTREALRKAPWNALARFPREWLLECMRDAPLSKERRVALDFLLDSPDAA